MDDALYHIQLTGGLTSPVFIIRALHCVFPAVAIAFAPKLLVTPTSLSLPMICSLETEILTM